MNYTLLIPTKNRFFYLKRTIKYYSDIEFKGTIFIIDSSDNDIAIKNKNLLKIYDKLNLQYFHFIGLPWQVMKAAGPFIKSEFVSFSGDDDYLVPNSIKKGITLLKSNSSFTAVNGDALCAITLKNRKKVGYFAPYPLNNRYEDKASERILELMKDYTLPLFSIHRTHAFKELLSFIPDASQFKDLCPVWAIADELLPASISVGLGKVTRIDNLLLVRTIHSDQYHMPSITENIVDFDIAINYYKKCMVALFQRDNLSQKKSLYISNQLEQIILTRHKVNGFNFFKYKFIYLIVFFKKILRAMFFFDKEKRNKKFYLSDYEHSSDLNKIYKSITT